jgi:hypothetical protein
MKKQILQTFKLIKQKKWLFVAIMFLQLLFFASLTVAAFTTLVPFTDKAKNVFNYINTLRLEGNDLEFGEDPLQFYHDYQDAIEYVKVFAITALIICLLLNNSIWGLTNHMYKKMKLKEFFKFMMNFIIVKVAGIAILFFLFAQLIKNLLETEGIFSNVEFIILAVLITVVLYVVFVFIASIGKRKIMDIVDKGLKDTIKLPVFLSMLVNFVLIICAIALFFWLGEYSLILVSILIIFLIFIFTWTKLFIVTVSEQV